MLLEGLLEALHVPLFPLKSLPFPVHLASVIIVCYKSLSPYLPIPVALLQNKFGRTTRLTTAELTPVSGPSMNPFLKPSLLDLLTITGPYTKQKYKTYEPSDGDTDDYKNTMCSIKETIDSFPEFISNMVTWRKKWNPKISGSPGRLPN